MCKSQHRDKNNIKRIKFHLKKKNPIVMVNNEKNMEEEIIDKIIQKSNYKYGQTT